MAIVNLFSKRQKRLRGEIPDVYQYTDIPDTLRVQIVQIIQDAFGQDRYGSNTVSESFTEIHKLLCREYGVFTLKPNSKSDFEAIFDFFLNCSEYEKVLDIIELTFRMIDIYVRKQDYQHSVTVINIRCTPDDAIDELNFRFREHGVGYQYESGELIRVDSQFLHAEAVKPALNLLGSDKRFKNANEEFLKAHEHYRHKRYKECLVDALKSFESVMKVICEKQRWEYKQSDTAQKLIGICFNNNLIPSYMESQFCGLRATLESGIVAIRNKVGGHGQGALTLEATETLASYALHLAAANILFLVKLEKEI